MAEYEVVLTIRSQAERLTIAENLIASVWADYLGGNIEDNNLQLAVNIQVNVNRIVWKLNDLNNGNPAKALKVEPLPTKRGYSG